MTRKTPVAAGKRTALPAGYAGIHGGIVELLDAARQAAARSVNALMTASYWEIGRRIVDAEQKGRRRAGYGEQLMERLSSDLTARFGRGFGVNNLESMRRFFLAYPQPQISQTVSGKLGNELPAEKSQTMSRKFDLSELAQAFTLPWSAYVRLLSVKDDHARQFYEVEALRGGWSVRQLDRQIGSQFYERTALSKDKAAMLVKGSVAKSEDALQQRADFLVEQGLAEKRGQRVILARNLLGTLRNRELAQAAQDIATEIGLEHRPLSDGQRVAGIYRRNVMLASGRYAMLDDGMGFSLVPWRPVIEQRLGQQIAATVRGGGVSWETGRQRGVSV